MLSYCDCSFSFISGSCTKSIGGPAARYLHSQRSAIYRIWIPRQLHHDLCVEFEY
ncbi:hypothetical protein BIW11_06201 [Tropilaelaps mercedesae]|uniref:Uncharacterized protein n=1 Tax=Tropilaelaps mercedesae TaxID=418985 RepID=A0A1V9XZ32_9ACAR|nr:hypothetical protein BIW11_06201 [Tropilaelaps mercedesae]